MPNAARDPAATVEPLVHAVALGKSFGARHALADLSFRIPAGQLCGLLGPNGAGKTTLFRLLTGVLRPSAGTLRIAGHDSFADRVAVMRLVGVLPDEPVFHSYLSGREILELSAAMHGLDPAEALDRQAPVLAALRLAGELDNYAEDYSRGTKKKLGLVLALLHRPRLLVLDEPTNGLDVQSTRVFHDLLRAEAARGTTVLFSTHLMDHVARLCSDVIVLDEGRLVTAGPLDELQARHGGADLEQTFLALTARPAPPAPL